MDKVKDLLWQFKIRVKGTQQMGYANDINIFTRSFVPWIIYF